MNNITLFLVEGEDLDVRLLNDINRNFFRDDLNIIAFKTNIYTLYKQLEEDEFETDLISILQEERNMDKDIISGKLSIHDITDRDQISEIFLFFDYDGHHYQHKADHATVVPQQLIQMLKYFDNETEFGKLYLSYPMIEAIHHFNRQDIRDSIYIARLFPAYKGKNKYGVHYKMLSKENYRRNYLNKSRKYNRYDWKMIVLNYLWGISYLYDFEDYMNYSQHLEEVTSLNTYLKQKEKLVDAQDVILVLSGYPQFLIEYFGRNYYDSIVYSFNHFKHVFEDRIE